MENFEMKWKQMQQQSCTVAHFKSKKKEPNEELKHLIVWFLQKHKAFKVLWDVMAAL